MEQSARPEPSHSQINPYLSGTPMVARICNPARWTIAAPKIILVDVDTKPTGQQLGVRRSDREEVINAALRELSIKADRHVPGWSSTLPANNLLQNICVGGSPGQNSTQRRADTIVNEVSVYRLRTELGYIETTVVQSRKMTHPRDTHLLAQGLLPLLRVLNHRLIERHPIRSSRRATQVVIRLRQRPSRPTME